MGASQSNRRELKLEKVLTTNKINENNIINTTGNKNNKSSKLGSSLGKAIKSSTSNHSSDDTYRVDLKQQNDFNEMFVAEEEVLKTGVSSKSKGSKKDKSAYKHNNNNNDVSEVDRNESQVDDSFGFEPSKLNVTNSMKHSNHNHNPESSQYYYTASLKRAAAHSQRVNRADQSNPIVSAGEINTKSRGNLYVDDPSSINKKQSDIYNQHSSLLSKTLSPNDSDRYHYNEAINNPPRDNQYHYENNQHRQDHISNTINPYQNQIQQVRYDPLEMAQLQELARNSNPNNNNHHDRRRASSSMDADVSVNYGGTINNSRARANIETSNYAAVPAAGANDIATDRSYASFRHDYEEYYYHGDNEMESNNEMSRPVAVAPVKTRGCNKENQQQQQRSSSLTSTNSSSESTPASNNKNNSKKVTRSKLSSAPVAATTMDSNNENNDVVKNIYVKVSPTLAKKYINSNHGNQLTHEDLELDGKRSYKKKNNSYHDDFGDDYHGRAPNAVLNHENDDDLIVADNGFCCDEIITTSNPNDIIDRNDEPKQSRNINLSQYIITHNELSKSSAAAAAAQGEASLISAKKNPATVNGNLVATANKNEQAYQFPYQQQATTHSHHSKKLNYDPYNSSHHQQISTPINTITNPLQICNNNGKQLFIAENHLNYPPYQHQHALNGCMMSPSNGQHFNNNNNNNNNQLHHIDPYQRHQMASNNQYNQYNSYANYHINSHQFKPSVPGNQQQIPMSHLYRNQQQQQQQAPLLDFHRYSANGVAQQASSRNHQLLINNNNSGNYYQHQSQNPSIISHKFEAANNLLPSNQYHQQHQAYLMSDDDELQLYQYKGNAADKSHTNYNDKKAQSTSSRLSWFGSKSSQTLDTRSSNYKKSSNPFASLFGGGGGNATSISTDNSKHHHHQKQQYSNTIHLGRSSSSTINNKASIANLMGISTPSQQQQQQSSSQRSAPGSLKRIKSSPLTAQQASYEAMRTIDMYLIRQIARSCMNPVLEQKIDVEIRLRELAARAMLEARDEIDALEVEKSLLTSDQRMNCYSAELERQRKQLSNGSLSTDSGRGSSKSQARLRSATRSDVIGPAGADTSSSTALSSPQTPSKLSPVSGQSADLPSIITTTSTTSNKSSSQEINTNTTNNGRNNSRTNQRLQQQLKSGNSNGDTNQFSPISSRNCLSRIARRNNKQREHLMQKITSSSNINCNMVIDNRASLSVSEIRIPLMWRDVDHFKGRGDYKRFAVFCLLKIDSQIYDTQLISDVDRNVTDITFDDVIVFNEISHSFELTLEVYSCVYLEHFSLASTPRKLKEKLASSVSRAMGRRLATQTASTNFTKELEAYDKSYRFEMIASANLRLDDAGQSIKTYDLLMGANNSSTTAHSSTYRDSANLYYLTKSYQNIDLSSTNHHNHNNNNLVQPCASSTLGRAGQSKNAPPLFGHFCCKLLVRPDVFDKNIKAGYLRVAIINVPNEMSKNNDNNVDKRSANDRDINDNKDIKAPSSSISSDSNKQQGDTVKRSNESSRSKSDPHRGFHQTKTSSSSSSSSNSQDQSKRHLQTALVESTKMATLPRSNLKLYWALLRNFVLYLWPIEDAREDEDSNVRAPSHHRAKSSHREQDYGHSSSGTRRKLSSTLAHQRSHQKHPKYTLNIDKFTRLLRVSNSSLTLQSESGCFVLAAASQYEYSAKQHHQVLDQDSSMIDSSNDEIGAWLRPIEQYIYDSHIWGTLLNHHLNLTQ